MPQRKRQPTEPPPLSFSFEAELFRWQSTATAWFFVRMPADQSAELREEMDGLTNGFGSIRVEATIRDSVWQTSVFPESQTKQYMLPVKAAIRKAQDMLEGEPVPVTIRVLTA